MRRRPAMVSGALLAALIVVTGLLAVVSPAWAAAFGQNLIVNGDAEAGQGGNGEVVGAVPGFTTSGNFTVVKYAAGGGFPTPGDPGPPDRGQNFFAGGPDNASSSASQVIDVSTNASRIDAGRVTFDLSGYLGGFENQEDNAVLEATFKGAGGAALGKARIGPVTAADRNNLTGLLLRTTRGIVPAETRDIEVRLQATRVSNGTYNDGYADNLSLVLKDAPTAEEQSFTTNEDTAKKITLKGTDVDSNDLTFEIVPNSGPSNGALSAIGTPACTGTAPKTCTAEVTYTPDKDYNGPDSFRFRVRDETAASNEATVSIAVAPVDEPAPPPSGGTAPPLSDGATPPQPQPPNDTAAPTIKGLNPAPGHAPKDRKRGVRAFVLDDDRSQVKKEDIRLYVDGEEVKGFEYDSETGRLFFDPKGKFSVGKHEAKVVVTDDAGNESERSWNFKIRKK